MQYLLVDLKIKSTVKTVGLYFRYLYCIDAQSTMGMFLPSETGRLVLGYLLDQGYEETRERFMSECGAIAELRDLDREDLEFACKVNNRSLTELLKEYNRSLLHVIITRVFNF